MATAKDRGTPSTTKSGGQPSRPDGRSRAGRSLLQRTALRATPSGIRFASCRVSSSVRPRRPSNPVGRVPPAVSGTPEESLTGDGNGVKTGAKIVRHGRSITFQMAEVMISRGVFQQVLDAIGALRPLPSARF
jgi:hypothetical protein